VLAGPSQRPVQYGSRITAIILYLYVGQFLSKHRTAQALAELFGRRYRRTVATMAQRATERLAAFTRVVRERIAAAAVAHSTRPGSESRASCGGTFGSTGKYSLITVHDKRGTEAMNAAGVLPVFTGVACHDAWAPYDTYTSASHSLCNAHALRELQAVIEQADPDQWCWASQVAQALRDMKPLLTINYGQRQVHSTVSTPPDWTNSPTGSDRRR